MAGSKRLDRFLYEKEKPFLARLLLLPLYLLSVPYGLAVKAKNHAYEARLLSRKRLPCPVLSIGNLTVGGTGKTPLTMAVAERLSREGISVAILSRGYKRKGTKEAVVSDGREILLGPKEAGDEPYLMARSLKGIPVLVGKDRFQTGRLALERFSVRGLLLDDGFQHQRLWRDLDILLLDSRLGFGDGHLLPRGPLREPLSGIRRARMVVLTKVEEKAHGHALENVIRRFCPQVELYHSYYEATGLVGPGGEWEELSVLRGRKVFVLSGVADPHSFFSLLRRSGALICGEAIFPDHHSYRTSDLTCLNEKVKDCNYLVTTEKDMVKLIRLNLPPVPLRALRVEMRLYEETSFYERILSLW